MGQGNAAAIQAAVTRLLKPLVRLLLRYGISYGAFADIAKRVYVEVAMQDFTIPGRKPTISRASVITGLTRKDVQRVVNLPTAGDVEVQDRYNRAVRVISGWRRDSRYHDTGDLPAALAMEGAGSFSELVRRYSGDMPVRAVLDELVRAHAVERAADGTVRLVRQAYIPDADSGEIEGKLAILGTDVADLVTTIDHNLSHSDRDSRFQLKVAYDNLPQDVLPEFRLRASTQAIELLKALDGELAQLDRDTNPAAPGSGRMRAGWAIYYFENEVQEVGPESGN